MREGGAWGVMLRGSYSAFVAASLTETPADRGEERA